MNLIEELKIPNWIKNIPKVEVHCHFEGSIRIKTFYELSKQNNIVLHNKSIKELKKKLTYKNKKNPTLKEYLDNIKIFMSVLTTLDSFERIAFEICEDCHKENIKYLELRFTATHNIPKYLNPKKVINAVLNGMKRAQIQYGIKSGLIISGVRKDLEVTKKAIDIAIEYKDKGIIGFDIAGRGNENKPSDYKKTISKIWNNNIPLTIHAGENDGPEGINEALKYLGAKRIGHGVTLKDDLVLMKKIIKNKIPLECCITSNIDTGVVKNIIEHPIKLFFSKGVICTIGTDNRTISNTTFSQELNLLHTKLNFTKKEIFQILKNNIKNSFMSKKDKGKFHDELEEYFQKTNNKNKIK